MSIHKRLERLERTTNARLEACGTCGAPIDGVPCVRAIRGDGTPLQSECPACGFPLNCDGRPMSALPPGSVGRLIIIGDADDSAGS